MLNSPSPPAEDDPALARLPPCSLALQRHGATRRQPRTRCSLARSCRAGRSSSLSLGDAEIDHGPCCTGCTDAAQRGEVVYRVSLSLLALSGSSTCRAQRGRSCERGAAGGGDFPLIPWAFDLGKKICHSNVTTAETMHEAFVRSEEAFMANSTPKVTQPPLLDFGWPEDQVSDHARPHPVPLAPVSQPRGHASSGKHARRGRRIMTKAACKV